MSKYLDLIKKRTAAAEPTVETVELCLDMDGYKVAREEWHTAQAAEQKARIRLAALKQNDGQGKRKLNAATTVDDAEADLEAAQAANAAAKARVREAFVILHVRGLTPAESRATYVKAAGDADLFNRASLAKALVKVTTHDGTETLPELTADIIADLLEVTQTGEANKIYEAINQASEAVDFPT